MARFSTWCFTLFILLASAAPASAQEPGAEETLSPYFHVKSDDPDLDALPLKSTSADVHIAGAIAEVTVQQTYVNTGTRPLEAIYIFPASTAAAVHGMTMHVGDRTIRAEIQEREQAREAYEEAKSDGKSASLLEQQRPNVFQMNVANILPDDTIRVTLQYSEQITPENGTYEFVYPTVVGPRYSNQPAASAPPEDQWVENPYLKEGEAPPYTFDFNATLSAGMPIQQVAIPSHKTHVEFADSTRAHITLTENGGGNRDLLLRYRLAGSSIASGLLLYEGDEENFFLTMLQPPERVRAEQIPPREYIFVVDVSGSMRGFPLGVSKQLLSDLITPLRPSDRFNVLLFAAGSEVWAEQSRPATEDNVQDALRFIDRRRGGGGTELTKAMHRALDLPGDDGRSRSVIVATDGKVSFEREVFRTIQNGLFSANVFSFGIGSSVNRFLIEGMARAGMGEPFVVTKKAEAASTAERFRRYVSTPALTQIESSFDGFEAYDVTPQHLPDLFAERPVVIFGKWRGSPDGTITLRGQQGNRSFERTVDVSTATPDTAHSALRALWARHRVAQLSDLQQTSARDDTEEAITDLGLQYNLLTRYTSFVAIDEKIRADGKVTTVKQPLPLPQGVQNSAVGKGGRAVAFSPSLNLGESLDTDARSGSAQQDIYVVVDSQPELIGGLDSLRQRIQYPEAACTQEIEGRVFVQLVVDKNGQVQDAEVTRSAHPLLEEEALRVIRESRFRPGTEDGAPVKVTMSLPVIFRLSDGCS